jgi:glycosyltransferase involved in cell wall biosynthesis
MKITCIVTVLNEETTIERLLNALAQQTVLPDEIIIVDGGSSDKTVDIISNFKFQISNSKSEDPHEPEHKQEAAAPELKCIVKKGNRAVGRNEAVKLATGDVIVCTDAGCYPDKHWVEYITSHFSKSEIDVVAGYYESRAETVFQECLVPYVFTMPDKIKPNKFLPASRSMAFTKAIWEKAGGFPEQYAHNEDYVFARTLKAMGAKIWFEKKAFVYWIPRKTFVEAFIMFYRFAYGDMEAKIYRPKVQFLFARYIIGIALLFLIIFTKSIWLSALCSLLFAGYLIWSVMKSYRYIDEEQAIFLLPAIQLTADAAVLLGSAHGLLSRLFHAAPVKTEFR